MDLDLDDIRIKESLLQGLERTFVQLEMAFEPRSGEPMVYDLGPSTITLSLSLFDRLVDRCILVRYINANAFLSSEDMDLSRMGLLVIREERNGIYYHMGCATTSAATYNVSITHTGRVILKLAGTIAIFDSLIRQGLFSILEVLLGKVDVELLPELLSHKVLRVRKLAATRLEQSEEA